MTISESFRLKYLGFTVSSLPFPLGRRGWWRVFLWTMYPDRELLEDFFKDFLSVRFRVNEGFLGESEDFFKVFLGCFLVEILSLLGLMADAVVSLDEALVSEASSSGATIR